MNRTDINKSEIEFYKDKINKFANIDYTNSDGLPDVAKGRLISVSDGKIFLEGTYKSFVVEIDKITNASFTEFKEKGEKNGGRN